MRNAALAALGACLVLTACTKTSDAPSSDSGAAPATGPDTTPEPKPSEPGAPKSGELAPAESRFGPVEVLGDAPACPPLPPTAQDSSPEALALAQHLRRLACEPQLHAMSTKDLHAELNPAVGVEFVVARGSVRVEAETWPSAGELAKALGVVEPIARVEWQAYHDSWYLGDATRQDSLGHFSPGRIILTLDLDAEEDEPPGSTRPLPADASLRGLAMVGMPESVVRYGEDPEGMKELVAALDWLVAHPETLALEPNEAATALHFDGERWRVARVSSHSGDAVRRGISIDPQRTRIPAPELAKALGLEGARALNVNREHDVWNLEHAGTTQIHRGGLVLEFDLDMPEDANGESVGLEGVEVGFISLLPTKE